MSLENITKKRAVSGKPGKNEYIAFRYEIITNPITGENTPKHDFSFGLYDTNNENLRARIAEIAGEQLTTRRGILKIFNCATDNHIALVNKSLDILTAGCTSLTDNTSH
jgi:hypothetical protein